MSPTVAASRVAAERTDAGGQQTLALMVRQVRCEADDVLSLTLVDPGGEELPEWQPGAHLDLHLPSGAIRQYSLCGDPRDRTSYTVAVLREDRGRGGSVEVHDTALAGRNLSASRPRNRFPLVAAPRYLFLAGGIGITPILAMVRETERSDGEWDLHYGGRSRRNMAFVDVLGEMPPGRVRLHPQDTDGLLPLAEVVGALPPETAIYCCGPEPMILAVTDVCADLGRSEDLHLERFGPNGAGMPDLRDQNAFQVELARSGVVLRVPSDKTLLEIVREAVDDVGFSCEEGYCGSCETAVLAGEPEHRDTVLSDAEREAGDRMMICVGRSRSPRLVLDL